MSYLQFHMQAINQADRILSGEYKEERKIKSSVREQKGLARKQSSVAADNDDLDPATVAQNTVLKYLLPIREDNKRIEDDFTLSSSVEGTAGENSQPSKDTNFLKKLKHLESSGDSTAEVTTKDGRRFVGELQFGEARLTDYKKATGKKFTQDEFKANPSLQEEVTAWHIKDLGKAIDSLGDKAKTYSRDGLMAVAHLGGRTGMKKYVQTNGEYNPADDNNTTLQMYYEEFSGEKETTGLMSR